MHETFPATPDSTDLLASILQRLDDLAKATAVPPQRFLSVRSAASYADLSDDSIRRLIERGDLVAYRPVRGKLLIDRQQLDNLILGSARPRLTAGRGIRPRRVAVVFPSSSGVRERSTGVAKQRTTGASPGQEA